MLGVVEVGRTHSEVVSLGDLDASARLALCQLGEDLVDASASRPRQDVLVADAGVAVPVFAPDGHTVGAVAAMGSTKISSREISLLHDAAAVIEDDIRLRLTSRSLAAQLAADQIEHAVESSLATVATATNKSWTTADVARSIADHGERAIGATMISLAMIDSGSLRFVHGDGVADEVAKSWVVSPLSAPIPMAACARSVEPIVLRDEASFDDWPVFREAVAGVGIESFMALPIVDPQGVVLASLGVGWSSPRPNTDIPVTVRRLVSITVQALGRALQHESAQDHVSMLESIVLPDRLPIAPGLEIFGRYLAPLFGQRVGGDVFDAWVRDDGAVAFLVADVSGHTLSATRTAAALRHSIGMLSLEMREPREILQAVNRYVQNSEAIKLATCCYCVVDVATDTLTIANAGHPQPRLRRSDGSVVAVGPLGDMLLGFGSEPYSQQEVAFSKGDSLVMFTDGLIDRRSADLLVSERRLERQLVDVDGMTTSEISAMLIGELEDQREDDVAIMVIRRPREETPRREALTLQWARSELRLSEARAALRAWFADNHEDVDEDAVHGIAIDDIVLVATELLTNARDAAAPGSSVELSGSIRGGRPEISVRNEGAAFSHRPTMPIARSPRGRGLAIVATLADLSVESDEGFITARAVLRPRTP